MKIQTIKVSDIKLADYNPRTMRADEFEGLKASLKEFGQTENFIVNKDMTLISGHRRLEAAIALGWKTVECNVIDVDKKTEKKLNVVMNNRSIQGSFDDLKLAEILEELKFDDNYTDLRLDTLEPLDLSSVEIDETTMTSVDEYRDRTIKQISFAFTYSEYEELMEKLEAVIKSGDLGDNPSEVFVNLVRREYENNLSQETES